MNRLRIASAAIGAIALLVASASVASADTGGQFPPQAHAQKVPLTQTNRDCDGSLIGSGGTVTSGFTVINQTPATPSQSNGLLIGNVVLQGAQPDTTYGVRLIQTPANTTGDCGSYQGPYEATLTTDDLGDGAVTITEVVITGATGAFVDINQVSNTANYFTSPDVMLSPS